MNGRKDDSKEQKVADYTLLNFRLILDIFHQDRAQIVVFDKKCRMIGPLNDVMSA